MARPREFDRDAALDGAIRAFREHGYEGTSTAMLLDAMGIGRQSLYDSFGDKHRLYVEALQRYNADSVAALIQAMAAAASPLAGLDAALTGFAARATEEARLGCLGVSSICEFGLADREVALLNQSAGRTLLTALERQVAAARTAGEAAAELDPRVAAEFLATTLAGMKVAARGGTTPAALRDIARMAIRSLR